MKHLGILLLGYLAVVCETSAVPAAAVEEVAPCLLPLAVLAVVQFTGGAPAVLWAAGLGLTTDCLGGGRLGIQMLAAMVMALVLMVLREHRARPALPMFAVYAFGAVLGYIVLTTGLQLTLEEHAPDLRQFALRALGAAGYSALLAFGCALLWRTTGRLLRSTGATENRLTNRWARLTE